MYLHKPHTVHPEGHAFCRVTYRMTDQMGVVYYGNYMELFEMGRNELMRSHNLDYRLMEAEGYLLPATRVECDYLQPAKFEDLLEIRTHVSELTRAKIHFAYEIRRAGEETLLTRGITKHVYLSPDGRIRRLSPEWWERLRALAPRQEPAETKLNGSQS